MKKDCCWFFRINSQKTIINTGKPFWNLFFQKKEVPWATHNGKSSKSGLHVAHGAPKRSQNSVSKREFFEFGNISRDISSEKFVFLLPVANTVATLRFQTFPAHMKNCSHTIYWRTHNRVSIWNPPWATWSPDLEDLPLFVAHGTCFFWKNRFQKGSPVFIIVFWELIRKNTPSSFIMAPYNTTYRPNIVAFQKTDL